MNMKMSEIAMKKRTRGSSLSELIALSVIFIAILLSAGDAFWIIVEAYENNEICARAARAASTGLPDVLKKGEPQLRAMSVLDSLSNRKPLFDLPTLVGVSERLTPPVPEPILGGPILGDVEVTTVVHVHPPFLLGRYFGADGLALKSSKSYPFTSSLAPIAQ